MIRRRGLIWLAAILAIAGTAVVVGFATLGSGTTTKTATSAAPATWAQRHLSGNVPLTGQVPLVVQHAHRAPAVQTSRLRTSAVPHPQAGATYLHPHPAKADIGLNFSFPLRDQAGLNQLILQEARTHHYLTRAQIYARFAPPQAQYTALRSWLTAHGFRVTHIAADRMSITVHAPTTTVEKTLHVKINDYLRSAFTYGKIKVQPFQFYANSAAPQVPARLGLQAISGLSDIDRFYTNYQLGGGGPVTPDDPDALGVRAGGYFPADLRGLYDVTGHGFDATGQTIGFTLWTTPERQAAMTAYATATGDTPITVDPSCVATGNNPTTPSLCSSAVAGPDHLLNVLENGNSDSNANFNSNVETALDIEAAHGVATHVGMKYYASECNATTDPGSGLTNAGCNGSDVGLEDAIEDAANDPTLHSVSNSWAFGGEAEWGAEDPFLLVSQNSFALAAAAGTTFYFSTGDSGTFQSGFPSDSQYVVAVGGTSTYSTSNPATYSTTTTWSGGGSWCSNVIARPAWQTGAGVSAHAPCPGRAIPDVSAIADPNTGIRFTESTNLNGGTASGQVGGTSLAAPVMNGLEAVTANFVAAQSYAGPTPQLGFEAPMLYQLGNSGNANRYYRDVVCGNTANPTGGPDGDAAQTGWDAATGWGEIDWFHFSIGYAIALGATNLSQPSSLSTNYAWGCAKTPSNSSERGISFPTSSTGFAVGAASGGTPWPGKFLPGGAWGAVNTFFKTTDGGSTWFPSNSDMLSVACTSSTSCLEVGVGGRERRTTDGGTTWTDTSTGYDKPLTQVSCASSSTCYAAGDRGTVLKSTDGGASWSFLASTGANPIYGLSCPTVSICYATDIYAHVLKTSDGGATWVWQQTPITTPGIDVPGSGGPNPFAGLLSISCPSMNTCVATGLYATVSGQPITNPDPPIITTTDGGATWTRQTSNAGTGNFLHSVSCLPGTTTCTAVGRNGTIVTTTDLATWTKVTSGTTTLLDGVDCLSASFCIAVGQNGTVDTFTGSVWTPTTGNGGTGILAGVTCLDASTCYAVGKQGITIATTNGGGLWTAQAGGGTTQQMNSISCVDASTCVTVGNTGTIIRTANGGQLWTPQTSGTASGLNGVSCVGTVCTAVGAAGAVRISNDGGVTWGAGTSGTASALNGVTCNAGGSCVAVGAGGTILTSGNAGLTWTPSASGVGTALNAVTCQGTACFADGAGGVLLASTDGGATWAPQASTTTQSLNAITCIDAFNCFAGGANGTVVTTTSGGAIWAQQGDPLSGPPSALNASNSAGLGLNVVACTALRCSIGAGSQGDMMTSPLLTVTVHGTTPYGTTPAVSGIAPGDASITYSVPSEAANVTGTLTCQTTATKMTSPGTFPITNCGGLSDSGFSVVYDYADSSYVVTRAPLTVTADDASRLFGSPNPTLTAKITGFVNGETLATSDVTGTASCTSAPAWAAVGPYPITCTVGTLVSAHNYAFTTFVPGTLHVTSTSPCITTAQSGKLTVNLGQVICIGAGGSIGGPLTVNPGGVLDIEGGTINAPLRITGSGIVRLCGATINAPLTISGATGLVLIGGDDATGTCAGNTITGPVELTGNKGGVEFNGNTVNGPLTISGTTGTLPPPDPGSLHVSGNTVTGPIKSTT